MVTSHKPSQGVVQSPDLHSNGSSGDRGRSGSCCNIRLDGLGHSCAAFSLRRGVSRSHPGVALLLASPGATPESRALHVLHLPHVTVEFAHHFEIRQQHAPFPGG